jgi:hypothetical protein
MTQAEALLQLLLLIILFCGLMPALGGGLLYQTFRKYNIADVPLPKCMTAFFSAAGVAYLLMMVLRGWLPEVDTLAGVVLGCFLVVLVELALIGAMLKRFSAIVLVVEAGTVVITNLVGYSLVLLSVSA